MNNYSINWREGMYLLPQQFQHQELFQIEQDALGSQIDHPYSYGFETLEFDNSQLRAGVFRIRQARGRLKDGTLFDFGTDEVAPLDLRQELSRLDAAASAAGNELFLGIRRLRDTEGNVDDRGESRYLSIERELRDLTTGDQPTQIEMKKLIGRLFVTRDREHDYELISLGRVGSRSDKQVGSVYGWESPFPPSLRIGASAQARDYIERRFRKLEDHLRSAIETIEAERIGKADFWTGRHVENISRFMALSEFRCWLIGLSRSQAVHPYYVYLYLCRLVGRMCLTDPERNYLPDLPPYNHDRPFETIAPIWKIIERQYIPWLESNIRILPFVAESVPAGREAETIHQVLGLKQEYFDSGRWSMCIGIYLGDLQGEEERRNFLKLISDAKSCYWKMGDRGKLNEYFVNRLAGLPIREWKPRFETLQRPEWHFAEIVRNEVFDRVRDTNSLCLRIDQRNLVLKAALAGSDEITVTMEDKPGQKRSFTFKFALWLINRS